MGRRYNWYCTIVAGFGSMLYGIDNAVIASTIAQPGFLDRFKPSPTLLGAIASAFYAGTLAGIIAVFILADRFSRKGTLQFGAALGLVGAVLQASAYQIEQFVVGRVLAGFASGIMLTTVQIYQSEIAPPEVRGRMVAVQLVTVNSGGQLIAFTGFGTYHASNPELQWRLPVALQCVPAIALLIGGFFIPFSPRWLLMRGRHEEARKVLQRLHDDNADHSFWEREYAQMVAQLEQERRETAGANFFHMFTNKKELHRALLAVVGLTSLQTNGAQTIFIFQSVLYASLGYSTGKILLMACVFQLLAIFGGIGNIIAIDWVGRRILMMSGLIGLSIILALFMVCVDQFAKTGSTAWGKTGVALVMIYIWFYGVTYISTGFAYAAEVLPTKIRAQGMALGMFSAYVCIIIFGQVTPIAYAEVSYRYISLFIAFNMFFLPIIYFYCHETKGLTLEEINALFGEEVHRRIVDISAEEAHEKAVGVVSVEEREDAMA